MAIAFFRVQLSVNPKAGGEAELVLPKVLNDLNYQFLIVREGGKEGIIQLEGSDYNLKQVENDNYCEKLTESQLETLKKSYPDPKLKQKYRSPLKEGEEDETANGNKIVDTWQTVRSGFYLIDVPVLIQP